MVKLLTEFSEATYMVAGSRSGVYPALLCGLCLSSMVMGGRLKTGLTKSDVKVLLK